MSGTPRLDRRKLLLFSAPGLPLQALGLPAVVYLPPYFAGELGMGLSTVGLIFFLVRAIDLPLDLAMGAWMDRTRTRWGRFRPWVAGGAVALAVGIGLSFFAVHGTPPWAVLAFLLLAYAGQASVLLAQTSWGATLTPDYAERSRLFGWWQAANLLGLLLTTTIPPLVGGGARDAVHAMGWWGMALCVLFIAPMAWFLPEGSAPTAPHRASLRDVIALAKNRLLMRLLAADLLINLAPGVTGALFRFYFERVLGYGGRDTGLLLLAYFASGLLCIPLWSWMARRWSKHAALVVAGLAYAVLQAGIGLFPSGNFNLALAGMALAGIPYAAGSFLLRALLADVADVDRLETGADRTGLLYAVLTTTLKVGYAIPIGLVYPALALFGFDPAPSAINDSGGREALVLMFTLLPAALMLIACALMWRWPLTAARHAEVRAALAARDSASRAG